MINKLRAFASATLLTLVLGFIPSTSVFANPAAIAARASAAARTSAAYQSTYAATASRYARINKFGYANGVVLPAWEDLQARLDMSQMVEARLGMGQGSYHERLLADYPSLSNLNEEVKRMLIDGSALAYIENKKLVGAREFALSSLSPIARRSAAIALGRRHEDLADDVANDALMKFYNYYLERGYFNPEVGTASGLISQISRNTAISALRSSRTEEVEEVVDHHDLLDLEERLQAVQTTATRTDDLLLEQCIKMVMHTYKVGPKTRGNPKVARLMTEGVSTAVGIAQGAGIDRRTAKDHMRAFKETIHEECL